VSTEFRTLTLPIDPTVVAPDGSDVRVLLGLAGGGMAHFELAAGQTARAVRHRTVEEIWYVVGGRGEMWRCSDEREEVTVLQPGVCVTIPRGVRFQFRAAPDQPVSAIAVTMPPWPGPDEAVCVPGPWEPAHEPELKQNRSPNPAQPGGHDHPRRHR
jgi:mannose-6-phosphate isomerase-like protein (cupin superfamily)